MKIVIVGGVAAGASAAARARRLDEHAEIVILEKGAHVSFANCGLPYHIGGAIPTRDALLLHTPQSLRSLLNLDVRTGHEVLAIDRARRTLQIRRADTGAVYEDAYDTLILCPGAAPIRPPIPGVELPGIMTLRSVTDMDAIKARVDQGARSAIVIGAGYIGLEMAESLAARGLTVTIVEQLDQVLAPLDPEMARMVEQHLRSHAVDVRLRQAATAFSANQTRLSVTLSGGDTLTADLVILAVGVRPDTRLAKDAGLDVSPRGGIRVNAHLQTSDPAIYAAGDAIEVIHAPTGQAAQIPLAGPANRQGRAVADHLYARRPAYHRSLGTSIVKVFDLTAGGTGANEKMLRQAGTPYRKVFIHPSGHASYYPGSSPMHMKLLFAPDGGRLLGAQVVGRDGVDKRIDVLATALFAGLSVYDLRELELAYAPPYGSAKDPVNMAGLVASNLLDGDLELWYAEDFPQMTANAQVIDVRGPADFAEWKIPGALNVPLGSLRDSLARLPREKRILLYCKVGFRSYLAYRILKQSGFTAVATLAGGTSTFRLVHPDL